MKDKIDKVQKEFDDAKKKIRDNEDHITKDQEYMTEVQSSTYSYTDSSGNVIRSGYPAAYYDSSHQIDVLLTENQRLAHTLDQYRTDAKQLDASKPKPKYTGVQNLIGVEGTPKTGLIADMPTEQILVAPPSTKPAVDPAPTPATATQKGVY